MTTPADSTALSDSTPLVTPGDQPPDRSAVEKRQRLVEDVVVDARAQVEDGLLTNPLGQVSVDEGQHGFPGQDGKEQDDHTV